VNLEIINGNALTNVTKVTPIHTQLGVGPFLKNLQVLLMISFRVAMMIHEAGLEMVK
jgi:hypothetical protein